VLLRTGEYIQLSISLNIPPGKVVNLKRQAGCGVVTTRQLSIEKGTHTTVRPEIQTWLGPLSGEGSSRHCMFAWQRDVAKDVALPGKGKSNSHGARPAHSINLDE
jgi:hypothetical protein